MEAHVGIRLHPSCVSVIKALVETAVRQVQHILLSFLQSFLCHKFANRTIMTDKCFVLLQAGVNAYQTLVKMEALVKISLAPTCATVHQGLKDTAVKKVECSRGFFLILGYLT